MLRAALVLTLALVLVAPAAAATPLASIAVGPKGLADPARGEPYYLWARVSTPVAPHPAQGSGDCGAGTRPSPSETANAFARDLLLWDPASNVGFSGWFPGCVNAEATRVCAFPPSMVPCFDAPGDAYLAYDVATGVYYARLSLSTPLGAAVGLEPKPTMELTGETGVGATADCETCPQPP